jgi:hypothetical protein
MTQTALELALSQSNTRLAWVVDFLDAHFSLTSKNASASAMDLDYWRCIDEDGVEIGETTFDPIDGTSEVGGATVTITDIRGRFNDLLSLTQGGLGGLCRIRLGTEDLPLSDYEAIFPLCYLASFEPGQTHNAWILKFDDAIGRLQDEVFRGASTSVAVVLTGNPLDLMLEVLTSIAGDAANGVYDTLAAGNGLGIDPDVWIDVADIEEQRAAYAAGMTFSFTINAPEQALAFIRSEILSPLNMHFITTAEGKLSVRAIQNVLLTADFEEITAAVNSAPLAQAQLDGGTVAVVLGMWDYNAANKTFASTDEYSSSDRTEAIGGRACPHEIKSRGIRTAYNGVALMAELADRKLDAFGSYQPTHTFSAPLSYYRLPVGSIIQLTDESLPSFMGGVREVLKENLCPAYCRVTPRMVCNHPTGVPDYLVQPIWQRMVGWSVSRRGATSSVMGNGDPGYSMSSDVLAELTVSETPSGCSQIPIQIIRKYPRVGSLCVDFEGILVKDDTGKRYGVNAPSGTLDYSLCTERERQDHWFVSRGTTGTMSDGSRAYGMV